MQSSSRVRKIKNGRDQSRTSAAKRSTIERRQQRRLKAASR